MSNISKRRKEGSRTKIKSVGDHKEFLTRITKTLYYGQLPTLPCLSLPVTEVSCEMWSAAQRGRSLRRLHADAAANIARQACVSPCALVLALLYLERLHACNPDYLATVPPQDLFLVSLMVGNKFLQDDGEDDEVICSEWAASGGIDLEQLKNLEMEFLDAIDWNVFVSEKSFEAGLSWLERQVALRQARLRGFFTYSELAATCGALGGGGELARAASAALAALSLAYVAGVVALLASALLVTPAWLPALRLARARASPADPAPSPAPVHSTDLELALSAANVTVELAVESLGRPPTSAERPRCCAAWSRRLEVAEPQRSGREEPPPEPRWSGTSLLEWVSRGSLADPLRRWLERTAGYAEAWEPQPAGRRRCERAWLDLTRLTALVATVTDR